MNKLPAIAGGHREASEIRAPQYFYIDPSGVAPRLSAPRALTIRTLGRDAEIIMSQVPRERLSAVQIFKHRKILIHPRVNKFEPVNKIVDTHHVR